MNLSKRVSSVCLLYGDSAGHACIHLFVVLFIASQSIQVPVMINMFVSTVLLLFSFQLYTVHLVAFSRVTGYACAQAMALTRNARCGKRSQLQFPAVDQVHSDLAMCYS